MNSSIPLSSWSKVPSDLSGGIKISKTTSATNGGEILTIAVGAGGSGYTLNDVITVSTGVISGTARVSSVNVGVVTGLELITKGAGYTTGNGVATTGGTGTLLTVNITASSKGNAALSTTCPATTTANPTTWVKVILPDDSIGYIPVWK